MTLGSPPSRQLQRRLGGGSRGRTRAAAVALAAFVALPTAAFAQAAADVPTAEQHKHDTATPSPSELPAFIPPLTDEDRKAAFPDIPAHAVHDRALHYLVLFDELEYQSYTGGEEIALEAKGWIGRDRDRLWFRADGDYKQRKINDAEAHVLYGKQFSRWWDLVMGVRQDMRPGPGRTWAAFGVQGLAPYWFEIEATGYVGESGRTQARVEVEYELRFTNRLALQPLVEVNVMGKSDPERGLGSGLSTSEAGFRLRYEIRREFAPYAGIVFTRRWGQTADMAREAGRAVARTRFVGGVRLWF
jgi:copper resistance protein B